MAFHIGIRQARRGTVIVCTAIWFLFCAAVHGVAQEATPAPTDKDIAAESLPLRTALHNDPSLKAPLDRLLTLYRGAGRLDELMGLYAAHVNQYPNDQNAQTVLIRLKAATGDPEALRMGRIAVGRFPKNAYLHYLLHELLTRRHDPGAIDLLDRAVELQQRPNRRLAWIDELLAEATATDRRELAKKHLQSLAQEVATAEARLELARKMIKFEFHELALEQLETKSDGAASPETMVAIQLEAVNAEVGLDRMEQAAKRLDELLDNLTADYWQREEINRRRLALIKSQSEREALIASRRQLVEKNPNDEAAVLDLAQILSGLQRRREALSVLLDAARRLPKSEQIEQRTLELFDRLRDDRGRAAFLAERLKRQPKRYDLALMRIKTQFQIGHRKEAKAALQGVLESVAAADRVKTALEMARFLRRATLLSDAAEMYRELIELAPNRLDVRRELAETYLAMGQRGRVRSLFVGEVSEAASLENLLDMVQFMLQQELLVEARTVLAERLKSEDGNLDLQLLLLSIAQKLGDYRGGQELIENSRAVADTAARYRQWLEAAVAFHDEYESVLEFLDAELLRLDGDPPKWTARRLERRLTFADVAADNKRLEAALVLLQDDLAQDLPAAFRIKIRRQLVAVLEKEPARIAEMQEQLKLLGEEDQRYADESKGRLAALYMRMQRLDLAVPLLDEIDLKRINDPALLNTLEQAYRGQNRPKEVLIILERLTQLNPTDRNNWQRWLTILAGNGDENRLRGALRQLLAGVNKLPLADDTRLLLESHLADSYWRSIARRMAGDNQSTMAEAIALLDAVERMAEDDQHWLWVNWVRAYALNRLGRQKERDEAIAELERIVALVSTADDGEPKAQSLRIGFPDGLSIDLRHARRLLSTKRAAHAIHHPATVEGPLPPFDVQWTFDVGAGQSVTNILPLVAERVLVGTAAGDVSCVDRTSGKLLWQQPNMLPSPPVAQNASTNYSVFALSRGSSRPLCDDQGRLFVPSVGEVNCYDSKDGQLLWRAPIGATAADATVAGATLASLFFHQDRLLTYEPASGTVTKVDRETGKVVWDKVLTTETPTAVSWLNSGASLSGDRLLVYGARSAILDVDSGEVLWSFEPWRIREFPVDLEDPAERKKSPPTVAATATPNPSRMASHPLAPQLNLAHAQQLQALQQINQQAQWGHRRHRHRAVGAGGYFYGAAANAQPTNYYDFILASNHNIAAASASPQFRMGLSSPAVVWATQAHPGQLRRAYLVRDKLLLWHNTSTQIHSTELPLSPKRVTVHGSLIGTIGQTAVFAYAGQTQLVDLTDGTIRTLQVGTGQAVGGGVPGQAAMQGALVYLSGPEGIQCFNGRTAQRVFGVAWPDGILDLDDEPQPATQPATASPYGAPGGHLGYPNVPQASPAVPPTAGCVRDGVLYTLVSPSRVVALKGVAADGS